MAVEVENISEKKKSLIHLEQTAHEHLKNEAAAQKVDAKKKDALTVAFALLLNATNLSMQSAQTDAKSLQMGQSQLLLLNSQENRIAFSVLAGPNGTQIQVMKTIHAQYYKTKNGGIFIPSQNPNVQIDGSFEGTHLVPVYSGQTQVGEITLLGYTTHKQVATFRAATANDFARIGIVNQKIEAQRNYVANKLMVVQQNSQVVSSTLNTTTDFTAQQIQEMGNLCSLMSQITNLICQLSKSQ